MVIEYAPRSVKQAIPGKEQTSKEQVARHAETTFKIWMKNASLTWMQVMACPWRLSSLPEWKTRKLFRHI